MKTVLITGMGKGIGAALANKFLAEGYFVIGTYFGSVVSPQQNVAAYKLDLSSAESIAHCVDGIKRLDKKIDIVINNAGVLLDEDETVVIPEKLRQTLEINVVGPIDFTERILPLVNSGGHIINIASSAGSLTLVGHESHFEGHYPSYKISKTAVNMYTRTLALRVKDQITVSSVHPGWVKTDMGGEEATLTPQEAAQDIFNLAISHPETGQFWFQGQKIPW